MSQFLLQDNISPTSQQLFWEVYTLRQPVSGTALRTIQFRPILLTSGMRDVKAIAILLQSQRSFPSNRNHVNVCHGGNAEVWLELCQRHSSARNRLSDGTKMGHICHSELRGIMSQNRSKYIFAGFTVKWRSLKRSYLRKCGRLAVAVSYIAECQKHSF